MWVILLKTKLTELESKISKFSSLATKTALTAVKNKIPSISSLMKKTDYDTKITQIEKTLTNHNHDKYIATPEFHTMTASVFNARLAQGNLITKADFDSKLSNLNRKITTNYLLKMSLKSWKHLIQAIFLAKVNLMKMVHKII